METRILLDSNGQDLAIEHVQDVEPILERNKQLRSIQQNSDWGREIAEIPCVILVKWMNDEIARGNTTIKLLGEEMDRLCAVKLRDPEWAKLRTDSNQVQGFLGFGS